MEEHLPPNPGGRGSSEPLVRHVTQAHPNDLVDPWWMDQALSRDYGEFIYRQWVVDVEDVEPEVVDRSLTEGVRLLRRGTLLNARRIQCVACIQLGRRMMWAGVAARDLKRAQQLLDALGRSFPEATLAEDEDPHVVLGIWGLQDESRGFRRLEVAPWSDIAANYAATTRESLAAVMDPGFSLEGQGQLLVWCGPPGTGKSYALGASGSTPTGSSSGGSAPRTRTCPPPAAPSPSTAPTSRPGEGCTGRSRTTTLTASLTSTATQLTHRGRGRQPGQGRGLLRRGRRGSSPKSCHTSAQTGGWFTRRTPMPAPDTAPRPTTGRPARTSATS